MRISVLRVQNKSMNNCRLRLAKPVQEPNGGDRGYPEKRWRRREHEPARVQTGMSEEEREGSERCELIHEFYDLLPNTHSLPNVSYRSALSVTVCSAWTGMVVQSKFFVLSLPADRSSLGTTLDRAASGLKPPSALSPEFCVPLRVNA